MDGGHLAGSETNLGLSVINCVISSCTDSRQERKDMIQPYPLWPLKHPLPGAHERAPPREKQMCSLETQKEPRTNTEKDLLWDPTGQTHIQ